MHTALAGGGIVSVSIMRHWEELFRLALGKITAAAAGGGC